jgi:hypothetical protein
VVFAWKTVVSGTFVGQKMEQLAHYKKRSVPFLVDTGEGFFVSSSGVTGRAGQKQEWSNGGSE